MKERTSRTASRLAIGTVIAYQLLLIALIFIRPELDPYWHPISEWALGRYGWIMIMAFLISALSYASLAVAITSHVRGITTGNIGLVILLICVMGTIGVGVFVTDPMQIITDPNPPPIVLSATGTLHIICGSAAMLLLPFAALLINLSLAFKNEAWKKSKFVLLVTGCLPLLGLTGFILHTVLILLPMGDYAYGPDVPLGWPARFLFLTYAVWVIAVAARSLNINAGRSA